MDQQSKNDNLSCCWFATIFKNLSVKNVFMFWCKTLLPLCQIYNISRILAAFACWHWSYLPLNGISSYPTHSLSNFDGLIVTQSKLRYSDRLKLRLCRLLCGYSTSRQCNIFIGCKPHSRISVTFRNYYSSNHQLVEHQPLNCEDVGSRPTWDKIFPHVCAHFGIHGRCGIVLPRLRLRGQLQNRTALVKTENSREGNFALQ